MFGARCVAVVVVAAASMAAHLNIAAVAVR